MAATEAAGAADAITGCGWRCREGVGVQERDQLAPSMFPSFATELVVVKGTSTVGEDDDFAVALFPRLKDAPEQQSWWWLKNENNELARCTLPPTPSVRSYGMGSCQTFLILLEL